jgi:hypothetical protein
VTWRQGDEGKRRRGDLEKRRIHPIISPTWISNPCDPDTLNYLPSIPEFKIKPPEIGEKENSPHNIANMDFKSMPPGYAELPSIDS